jgi:hypothetical protein
VQVFASLESFAILGDNLERSAYLREEVQLRRGEEARRDWFVLVEEPVEDGHRKVVACVEIGLD